VSAPFIRFARRAASAALLVLCAPFALAQSGLATQAASGYAAKDSASARRHMVVAASPLAVEAGLEMLRAGGSALDAAIAVQMVLGLVEPQSSGIGGGAFLLHWSQRERRVRSYDGRETAPAAARPERFLDAEGKPLPFFDAVVNGLSVGVPGVLRMLELAHRRHGRLPWVRLLAPAIRLAESGFAMSPRLHQLLAADRFLRDDPAARALYYGVNGQPKPVGATIVNADYAETLKTLAALGADALYSGGLAAEIVRAVRLHRRPGDMTLEDLRQYRAIERAPVCNAYRGWRVCGMGPPSSGAVTVLQILALLERTSFVEAAPNSAEAVHLFGEAGRLAFADRARYLADPDFVPQPVAGLLDRAYLEQRAQLIGERSMGRAEAGVPPGATALAPAPGHTSAGTSHLSIVDERGDAVSMTTTIENAFGSRIMVRGFLLNNELTDFSFAPQAGGRPVANRVEPGKRPRSSMAPTLVFDRGGRLAMALGSPGGSSIINYVARTLVATLDWGIAVQDAVALPNYGSRNGPTEIEHGSVYEGLVAELRARGHEVRLLDMTSGLHAIVRAGQGWRGGADPRREGVARGD